MNHGEWVKKGTKVVFTTDQRNGWAVKGKDNHLLILNRTYTVLKSEVRDWHTKVWLKEHPNTIFNSVCFSIKESADESTEQGEII